MPYRVAVAGFQHETNTFGATKADLHEFEMADSWPGKLEAEEITPGLKGMNIPLAGFIEAASQNPGLELIPILWCAAEPSAHVTSSAYEAITDQIRKTIQKAGPIDAIYLDLHGAMVTEDFDDGEGELLRRLRADHGPDLPIVVSLDLHANISPEMVSLATAMTIFRTYPHLDMALGGARALTLLMRILSGWHPAKAFRQVPLLLPLHAQFTGKGAGATLYDAIKNHNATDDLPMDIALGFTASDTSNTCPSIIAYADDQGIADQAVEKIFQHFLSLKEEFRTPLLSPKDGVMKAIGFLGQGPQVIADVQDNPGAGGSSDTTGLLRAMLDAGVTAGVMGIMADPLLAAQCHDVGIGGTVIGSLGGQSGHPDDTPFDGIFKVMHLSDGFIPATGAMYGGSTAALGPSALVKIIHDRAEVEVVVSSQRIQCLDQVFFRHFGVELETRSIIGLKSTVHYRADFDMLSDRPINVAAPGLFPCSFDDIDYKKIPSHLEKL